MKSKAVKKVQDLLLAIVNLLERTGKTRKRLLLVRQQATGLALYIAIQWAARVLHISAFIICAILLIVLVFLSLLTFPML